LTVTADAASKVYGDADDLKYTSSGLIHGDRLGGSLGRAAGENVGSYAINQGSLANSNYSISFTGNQLQITPKALTVTADAASKVYGDADDLKYTSSGLIHGDRLGGSLGRAAGKTWAAMPLTRAAWPQQLQHHVHGRPAADHTQGTDDYRRQCTENGRSEPGVSGP
jgi:hypothetical protein